MGFEPTAGALLGQKYRLEQRLASGGMGSVWVARHEALGSRVAVKFVARELVSAPGALARFEREAKATAQLSSPHVVRVHDFGVEDGVHFMVMELLEGEDLATRLDRVGRLSSAEAGDVAVAIGKALRAAHDVGLVHRDLKPRNVFLATQGRDTVVKLLDFGIARETRTQLVDDRTSSGLVLGSPYHMPPEQARGLEVDHRADLWSFGVVLYRALTGVRPFEGESSTILLFRICMDPHPLPSTVAPDLPPALDGFFARALHKDPEQRFASADAMVTSLLEALGGRAAAVGGLGAGPVSGALAPAPAQPRLLGAGDPATDPVVGREGPTRSQIAGAPGASAEGGAAATSGARELTGSRELSALSAGVDPSRPRASRRPLLAVAVVAAVALAAALALRGPGAAATANGVSHALAEAVPPGASTGAPAAPPAAASPGPAVVPTDGPGVDAAPLTPTVRPEVPASASASPPPAPRRPPPRPPPAAPRPAAPPAGPPAVDPFTGLPIVR